MVTKRVEQTRTALATPIAVGQIYTLTELRFHSLHHNSVPRGVVEASSLLCCMHSAFLSGATMLCGVRDGQTRVHIL